MDLGGRLLRYENASSSPHMNRAFQFVAAKYSCGGMHQYQVRCRLTPVQKTANLERYLTISVVKDGLGVLLRDNQIHPCAPSDFRERNTHISVFEQKVLADPLDDLIYTMTGLQIRKDEGLCTAHQFRVAIHNAQVRAHMGRQVDFVDYEQV